MLTVILSSVGNPDLRQDPTRPLPGVPTAKRKVKDFAAASQACLAYIALHELGGGNWNGGDILDEQGKRIASVSYNGFVWPPGEWTPGAEPLNKPPTNRTAVARKRRR
jgi:hypothetical protein